MLETVEQGREQAVVHPGFNVEGVCSLLVNIKENSERSIAL